MKIAAGFSVVAGLLAMSLAAFTAAPPCSIHPPKGTKTEDLKKLVKVPEPDARKAAIASLKAQTDPVVRKVELEVEEGCLVWSIEMALPGQKGVEEVLIDAGNGEVLKREHEGPKLKGPAAIPKTGT